MSDEIIGYRCPSCKTINPKNVTYCTHCGSWLLDTVHEAQPVRRSDFSKPSNHASPHYNRTNTDKKSNTKTSWVVFITIVVFFIYFCWPKTQVVQAIHYQPDISTTSKDYSWTYNNEKYAWHVEVPNDLLEWDRQINSTVLTFYDGNNNGYTQQAMEMTMPDNEKEIVLACSTDGDIRLLATEVQNYDYIVNLAVNLNAQAEENNFNAVQKIEFIQSFVGGAIPYVVNAEDQLPAQTLIDGGNCETKSILLASILKYLNYKVALLDFKNQNHMSVGISTDSSDIPNTAIYFQAADGTKYFYLETTEPGWTFGAVPTDQNYVDPQIIPIK
jgi:hypothetical protein